MKNIKRNGERIKINEVKAKREKQRKEEGKRMNDKNER